MHGVAITGNNTTRVDFRRIAKEEVENLKTDLNHQFIFNTYNDKTQGLVAGAMLSEQLTRNRSDGTADQWSNKNISQVAGAAKKHKETLLQTKYRWGAVYQTLLTQIERSPTDLGH